MPAARVDGRTARWAGHREQRREAFVDAALVVLDRVGASATVDQVAAEAGATRQALYRHFADRSDLDAAIASRAADLLVADLLPLLDAPTLDVDRLAADGGEASVEAVVRALLHGYLDHVQKRLSLYRFVRAHEADVAAGSAVRRVKDTVGGRIAAVAGEVLVGLDLPPRTAEVFATGMIGMADAVLARWLDDPDAPPREEVVGALVPMLVGAVQGVTGRRSAPAPGADR